MCAYFLFFYFYVVRQSSLTLLIIQKKPTRCRPLGNEHQYITLLLQLPVKTISLSSLQQMDVVSDLPAVCKETQGGCEVVAVEEELVPCLTLSKQMAQATINRMICC